MMWLVFGLVVLAYALYKVYNFAVMDCDGYLWARWTAVNTHAGAAFYAGKVVWITGSSSGIGRALALDMASRGAIVVVSARRVDRLEEVAKECEKKGAKGTMVQALDILDTASHKAAADAIIKKFGKIDILVNNAGRSQRSLAEDTSLDVDRAMLELNVIGTISVTKAVLPHMIEAKSGRIVVTSSIAGKVGSPCSAMYSATKHAVQGFFDALRTEVVRHNIHVTVCCPGPVLSEGQSKAFTSTLEGKVPDQKDDSSRLSAERCAELMSASVFLGIDECWITTHPILLFAYVSQYLPMLGKTLGKRVGPKRVKALKEGKMGYGAVQSGWTRVLCPPREKKE